MNQQKTKITEIVSKILNSAIESAIEDVEEQMGYYSAVSWAKKPYVSASTEKEADNNGSPDIVGLYCSFFEEDSDSRFVPFDSIIDIEMEVPTDDEIRERVAIWRKFADMMEEAGEKEIQARALTPPQLCEPD